MKLYVDTETRSAINLKKAGVVKYVSDPYFRVLICTWAIDDSPVRVWQPVHGERMPKRLFNALKNEDVTLVMHNSAFDRRALNASSDFLSVNVTAERIHDSMVQALAHGLPGDLDTLSELFRLGDMGKMKEGKKLIQVFCVPARNKKAVAFYNKSTHPKDWDTFVKYAKNDVEAMRKVSKLIPTLNYPNKEHRLWVLDQDINGRGLPVDIELAEAAAKEAGEEKIRLNAQTKAVTDGAVTAATQRDALLLHLAVEHDVWLPDLKADTLESYAQKPDLPEAVRRLIQLRQDSSLTTAAKYLRVLERAADGRLYDTMQMYGASRTGRDAGRVFQPQNLMRPTRWKGLEGASLDQAIEADVQSIKDGTASLFESNVMDLLGNCVRGVIRAPKGKKLVVADLSNIEGRGLVWLSGEEWKLRYFRSYDKGQVEFDNYVMAYARAMNEPASTVDKYQRAIGKVMELGLGYSGGVAAFLTFAAVYRLDIGELAGAVWQTADPVEIGQASDKFEWAKEHGYSAGLPQRQYAACEYLKQQWRKAHPETCQFWAELDNAFRKCIGADRTTVKVRDHLAFRREGHWLYIRLPSGRCLTYLQPKVIDGECNFIGKDPYTRRIERIKTYCGKLAENVTSGTARDVMFHRLPDVEAAGYKVVLRVHDELVCETPDSDEFTAEGLSEIMTRPFDWSEGLPLAAAGFETHRYRKD